MKPKIRTIVVKKGSPPLCLKSFQQCRGCFGWRNMINAAHEQAQWQNLPLKCPMTGLTLKVETDHAAQP